MRSSGPAESLTRATPNCLGLSTRFRCKRQQVGASQAVRNPTGRCQTVAVLETASRFNRSSTHQGILMNEQVITDVQSTWKIVEGIAPKAAAMFYANLFEADPTLKPLFIRSLRVRSPVLQKASEQALVES
jgi:hypothetical protein